MPTVTVAEQRPKAVRWADGRRAPTPLERRTLNLTGQEEEASIIDTNMLLDRLREAAAAAEVTLAEEAAAEARAAREAEDNLKRRAFLGADTSASKTPHIDAVAAAAQGPEMQARFSELDRKLRSASEAVEEVAMVYATAVRDGVFNKITAVPHNNGSNIRLPRFWAGEEERLTAVKKELASSGRLSIKSIPAESSTPGLTGEDEKGIISEFVSEVTGRRARTAAARGQLRVLQTIQAERHVRHVINLPPHALLRRLRVDIFGSRTVMCLKFHFPRLSIRDSPAWVFHFEVYRGDLLFDNKLPSKPFRGC